MEACLELMASGAVISIQDMGAAGLTCSAVEMGDKGGLGIRLDLDRVPVREAGMTAYEMMLSEARSGCSWCCGPRREAEARPIFEKWDLDFAVVGETIPEDRFLILLGNEVKADLPAVAAFVERARIRPALGGAPCPAAVAGGAGDRGGGALRRLLQDPNHAWKGWVWEQYDSQVGADTVRRPGAGAGIVRVHGTGKAVAFTSDVTPRYVKANPVEGGRQAVAERGATSWR
jgi:phosphoribosylformylglycinamidine synthase